ncbi:MAG: ABC transporter permease, partial [Pseudomonadota bacterium]
YLRDLMQVTGLVTTATLFLAPIFYPITAVPEPYRQLLYLNPITFTVEQARAVGLYGELPDWGGLAVYYIVTAVGCWLGYVWFQKTRSGFADVV